MRRGEMFPDHPDIVLSALSLFDTVDKKKIIFLTLYCLIYYFFKMVGM